MSAIILPLHLLTLAFIAWNVILADHMGFTWMSGKSQLLDEKTVAKYHRRMWIGLIIMIITGFSMFWPMREFLLAQPQFFVKMGFVIALVINGLAIGKLLKVPTIKSYASLSTKEKIPFIISGAVSTLCWIGAALGGYFLIPE